jgi:NAD+ synthase
VSDASVLDAAGAAFDRDVLKIDAEAEADRIAQHLFDTTTRVFNRRGGVVGVSGGVDSAVSLALSVRAFGPDRVVALILQEKESNPINAVLARELCQTFGVTPIAEDITAALEGFGCYRRRDDALRELFPEYDSTYRSRITLPSLLETDALPMFSATIVSPEGEETTRRLPLDQYRRIVAATNFKQRTRMSMLYHHAECLNYAVIGTANRNERDQGFFVKYGDGGADVDALAHLYKTQVYELAAHLGVPDAIVRRPPTTDTYSASTTEEEFFFRLPFETMDLLWYAEQHDVEPERAAALMGLSTEQVARAFKEFAQRRRTTEYLRAGLKALRPVGETGSP